MKYKEANDVLEGRYLVLDASRSQFQVGILNDGQWSAFSQVESPVLSAVETHLRPLLASYPLKDLEGAIYCQGPGSTLGLRATLSLVGAWQVLLGDRFQLFHYGALEYTAARLRVTRSLSEPFCVVTPARLGFYHCLESLKKGEYALSTIPSIPEEPNPVFYLPQTKLWKATVKASHAIDIDYSIENFPDVWNVEPHLVRATLEPKLSVFSGPGNDFVRWERKRHSGVE